MIVTPSMTAERIVNELLELNEVRAHDYTPPKPAFADDDSEIDFYARQPFTAFTHAFDRGHHPKLWQVVKGSVYEPQYRKRFGDQLREDTPRMKTLKANRIELTDAERKEVMKRGAVWHHGADGKPSPAVWKSQIGEKIYYVCNTHRAVQVKPTLKGAIRAFRFIKTTS